MPKMESVQKNGPGLSMHHYIVAYFMSHSNSIGYSMAILLDIVGGGGREEGVTSDG